MRKSTLALSVALLSLSCLVGCGSGKFEPAGCTVEGPQDLMPPKVAKIRLGISKHELEGVLGEPDDSPVEGQYRFGTGGDCPLEGGVRLAPCGLVAEFRRFPGGRRDAVLTDSLQSCFWGAIGE
jgi:hypothetical protein